MSISKEERERITKFAGTVDGEAARLMEFPEDHDTESRELASDAEALAGDTRTLLEALDAADEQIAELQQENRRVIEDAAREGNDAEAELAPALGYEYDEEYGWVTGDHTSVTLAMEARRKIGELQQENEKYRREVERLQQLATDLKTGSASREDV